MMHLKYRLLAFTFVAFKACKANALFYFISKCEASQLRSLRSFELIDSQDARPIIAC